MAEDVSDRVFDLLDGAMTRKGIGLRGADEERYWRTFDLLEFVVEMKHPGLDLDWAADQALEYTRED